MRERRHQRVARRRPRDHRGRRARKLYGQGLLARLNATGAAYDADNARLRTTVDADDATYSAALTTWTTAMGPVWTRATNLCRYLEAA
jgi:hypothetical protein